MRTLLLVTSALVLCSVSNIALAGDQTLSSNAAAAVDWKYDLTSPARTLSAKSQHVDAAGNADIKIGSHALSPVRSATGSDKDVLNIANSNGAVGIESNAGLSHSLSAAPVSTESSRLLPVQ